MSSAARYSLWAVCSKALQQALHFLQPGPFALMHDNTANLQDKDLRTNGVILGVGRYTMAQPSRAYCILGFHASQNSPWPL